MKRSKSKIRKFFEALSLPHIALMLILFLLLKKGAEYLLESGNSETLIVVSSMFIAVIVAEAIMTLFNKRGKNQSDKE